MLSSRDFAPVAVEPDILDMVTDAKLPNLPAWTSDPTARRYLSIPASHQIVLTDHPSFVMVGLYLNPGGEGGCIIHQTAIRTVLALEYDDADMLGDEWHDTVRHYAKWWVPVSLAKDCA